MSLSGSLDDFLKHGWVKLGEGVQECWSVLNGAGEGLVDSAGDSVSDIAGVYIFRLCDTVSGLAFISSSDNLVDFTDDFSSDGWGKLLQGLEGDLSNYTGDCWDELNLLFSV